MRILYIGSNAEPLYVKGGQHNPDQTRYTLETDERRAFYKIIHPSTEPVKTSPWVQAVAQMPSAWAPSTLLTTCGGGTLFMLNKGADA